MLKWVAEKQNAFDKIREKADRSSYPEIPSWPHKTILSYT
jgi:hypothetical protein